MAHVGTLADDEGPPHIRKLPNKCHICETNKHDSVCTGCLGDVSAPGGPHKPTKVCKVSCGDHAQRAFGDAAHELQDYPCSRVRSLRHPQSFYVKCVSGQNLIVVLSLLTLQRLLFVVLDAVWRMVLL
jgi:hypothetical protein